MYYTQKKKISFEKNPNATEKAPLHNPQSMEVTELNKGATD